VNAPCLRRLSGIAWLSALSCALPSAVAVADGLLAGHARHALLPDYFATLAAVGLPVWVLTLFGGWITFRRSEPRLAPADARYPGSRRLAGLVLSLGVLASVVEVLCFEFWPGRQDVRWFGSVAGLWGALAGLGVLIAISVHRRERRLALGLWTDPRAIWQRLSDAGGSPNPAVAVYYGRGPGAR
jgi:hypothetical protein